MFKHVYVWDKVVRIFHWSHVASIIVLSVTGFYIGFPFVVVSSDTAQTYLMAWVRYIHFVFSFLFILGFLVRGYWSLVGNRYASWKYWIPTTRERWSYLWKQLKYYLFLTRERPSLIGHNPFAGLTYTALGIMIVAQAFTGYALYAEPYSDGFWRGAFGWLLLVFGNQFLRWTHHVLMWLFIVFSIVHLYMAILSDLEEGDASITSMISGIKFEKVEKG